MNMKKIYTLIVLTLTAVSLMAQGTTPNRLIVRDTKGQPHSFVTDRVDSIFFDCVEGEVAAHVTVKDVLLQDESGQVDQVTLSVTRTESCQAFAIACMTKVLADALADDASVAYYFENQPSELYYTDFTDAQMTGFDFAFVPGGEYAIITLGYDKWGTPSHASVAHFTAPGREIQGTPSVTGNLDQLSADQATVTFTPNKDVAGYACCLFLKGEAESQFAMWGPMMQFSCIGDMVKAWGYNETVATTKTWNGLTPNTEYEVLVQCWDAQGTYADLITIPFTTLKLGGEGVAEVSIEVKEFGGNLLNGFWQRVVYTPNDQSALHRDIIIEETAFNEKGEEGVKDLLMTDFPEDPYWDQYGVNDVQWEAKANTTYYAVSMAKNINDEWGPLAKVRFTTPSSEGQPTLGTAKKVNPRPGRMIPSSGNGRVPAVLSRPLPPAKLRLTK